MSAPDGVNGHPLNVPANHDLVEQAVGSHLTRFGQVLTQAWDAFTATRRLAPEQMAYAAASSRGMLVSDFTREPAHRIFNPVAEATVDDQFGRPWVSLAGGSIRVRFRKLSSDLGLCRSDSDRALSLAYHLGDPCLPGMETFTVLTAGYVLDAEEESIERLELVCHLGFTDVFYSFPIPVTTASTHTPTAGTAQLPIMPLSPPIIRSAQNAAAKRIADSARPAAPGESTGGRDV